MDLVPALLDSLGESAARAAGATVVLQHAMQLLTTSIQIAAIHLTDTLSAAIQKIQPPPVPASPPAPAPTPVPVPGLSPTPQTLPAAIPGQSATPGIYNLLPEGAAGPTDPSKHYRMLPPEPVLPRTGSPTSPPTTAETSPGSGALDGLRRSAEVVVQTMTRLDQAMRLLLIRTERLFHLTSGTALPAMQPAVPPPRLEDSSPPPSLDRASPESARAEGRGGSMAEHLRRTVEGLANLAVGTTRVVDALTPLRAVGEMTGRGLAAAAQALAPAVRKIGEDFALAGRQAMQALAPLAPAVAAITARLGQALGGLGQAGRGAVGVVAGTAGMAATGATSAASLAISAVSAPIAVFNQLTNSVRGFVEALNPSAGLMLTQALRDLSATIGVALQPVMRMVTQVIRDFGSALLPVMQKLRPIFEQLSNAFGAVAGTFINAFASILTSLMPAFRFLADVVSALVPVFQAWYATLAGFAQAMIGAFSGLLGALGLDVKNVAQTLKTALGELAKHSLLASASILKWIDSLVGSRLGADFIDGVKKALLPAGEPGGIERQDNRGIAAALNPTIGALQSWASSQFAAGLNAGPLGGKKPEDEQKAWRESVLRNLDAIAQGKQSELGKMLENVQTFVGKKFDEVIDAIKGSVWKTPVSAAKAIAIGPSISFSGLFGGGESGEPSQGG